MKATSLLVVVAAMAVGCGGPSVEEVCTDLAQECGREFPEAACSEEGKSLEGDADRLGCEEHFDTYLDCIDEHLCGWRARCDVDEAFLRDCIEP